MRRLPLLAAALASLTLTLGTAVHAADVSPVDPSVDVVADTRFSILAGAGVGFAPAYEGSDEYRAVPFPILAPSFGASEGPRRFEFRGLDDIRVHAVYLGNLSFGPLAGYRFGRDEDDADRLRGTGDIDGGLVVGGFVNYDFVVTDESRIGLDVSISSQVTGDVFDGEPFERGTEYGIETGVALSIDQRLSDRLRVSGRTGLGFADGDYMQTGFGVTNAQAAASSLSAFDPDGGLKNVYAQVTTTYNFTERFEMRASLGYSRLVGDAADSPITADANQFSGALGLAYRFRF